LSPGKPGERGWIGTPSRKRGEPVRKTIAAKKFMKVIGSRAGGKFRRVFTP